MFACCWARGTNKSSGKVLFVCRYLSQILSPLFPSRPGTPIKQKMSENKGKREEEEARPWQSYHTVFTNAKAGMDGVDKEKVQKIVYEMSKGSKYFENEKRKEEFIKQKIDNMRERCAKLTATDISHHQMVADKRIVELEAARDLSKTWLHVDMDAFYAAVETLVNPSLRGKPMAVGSMSMLSTANYEARKFGVRAAMPGFIARKLCPDLIFVPVDFKKYTYYSELTRKVFQKYDPNFIASSLDEAYLDITEVCKERDVSGEEVALELRTAIYEETGLTCSAGVAPNRLLAKVCSDINKPNGQFVLPNDRMAVMTFISSLPIRKIGGIGKVTEHILRDVLGISTCEEMLQKSAYLCALFSHSSTDFFFSVSLGLGGTETPEVRSRKSMSTERTFAATEDEALLYKKLADIAETLSSDMQKEALSGRTLTLKLKTMSFEVRSRAVSLQKYISSSEDILRYASKLLKAELPLSVRLIGLRISHFSTDKLGPADPAQKTLMDYVISKEASATVLYGESSRGSDSSHNHFITDEVSKLPLDAHEARVLCGNYTSDSGDPSNSIIYTDFGHESHIWNDVAGELEKPRISQSNECLPKMSSPESLGFIVPSNEADGVQTADTELSSGQSKPELAAEKGANLFDKKQSMSLNENEQSIWVDEYKCSLCGVELPPSFIEERQEHSDYHLAEMLQKEESEHNSRNIMCRQRSSQKAQIIEEKKRKKHKVSPKIGKHIPIDLFFAKSNQNF